MLPRLVLVNNAASGGQARDDAHCSVWPHCWATQNAQDLQKGRLHYLAVVHIPMQWEDGTMLLRGMLQR